MQLRPKYPISILFLSLFTLLLLTRALPAQAAKVRCSSILLETPVYSHGEEAEYTDPVEYYFPIEFGIHSKGSLIRNNPGEPFTMMGMRQPTQPVHKDIPFDMQLDPDADPHVSSYFVKMTFNPVTSEFSYTLFSMEKAGPLHHLLNKPMQLTWKTYSREETVDPKDIASFKVDEKDLDPRRKITLVVRDKKNGAAMAIMRIYDGSPFPALFFGDKANSLSVPTTDPRTPLERRHPELDLRSISEYIFEPGRLARSLKYTGHAMGYLFAHFSSLLKMKYGFLGLAPPEFWNGLVAAEITGRNLEKFMTAYDKGGWGFTLHAVVKKGEKAKLVKPGTTFKQLKTKKGDTDTKYIVYVRVKDMIENFHGPHRLAPETEVLKGYDGSF